MRFAMRSLGMLAAVWLLVTPAMGVAAQGGAMNGYIWDGSAFLPEVAALTMPEALPLAGSGTPNGAPFGGYIWDGSAFLPEVAATLLP